ncbi:MAG: hypothetical protein QM760_16410 [Nibricoccus sp.]
MTDDLEDKLGFAPDYDSPVPYMQRTRDYYIAIGYTTPYRWAHYIAAPFHAAEEAAQPSRASRSSPPPRHTSPTKGDQGPGAAYNGSAKFYQVYSGDTSQAARSAHLAHRLRPHAHHRDRLQHLVSAACTAPRCSRPAGSASVAPRFLGAPTNRSHRITIETDAPEILAACREDDADVGDPGAELPGLPSDHGTDGPPS